MQIATDITSLKPLSAPCGLTIGTFDGVHLGHQTLFRTLRSRLAPKDLLAVLTFSNHPSDVFAHRPPIPMLTTLEHKLKLFAEQGIDLAIVIPFTLEFAAQPFATFLTELKQKLNFTHLVLGEGASFGKDRQGDESEVRALSQSLHFTPEYLPKAVIDGLPVSSGRIRGHLAKGEFNAVKALLGRPYSIFSPLIQENMNARIQVEGLCLPPKGTYPIQCKLADQLLPGHALIDQTTGSIQLNLLQSPLPFQSTPPFAEIIFN